MKLTSPIKLLTNCPTTTLIHRPQAQGRPYRANFMKFLGYSLTIWTSLEMFCTSRCSSLVWVERHQLKKNIPVLMSRSVSQFRFCVAKFSSRRCESRNRKKVLESGRQWNYNRWLGGLQMHMYRTSTNTLYHCWSRHSTCFRCAVIKCEWNL